MGEKGAREIHCAAQWDYRMTAGNKNSFAAAGKQRLNGNGNNNMLLCCMQNAFTRNKRASSLLCICPDIVALLYSAIVQTYVQVHISLLFSVCPYILHIPVCLLRTVYETAIFLNNITCRYSRCRGDRGVFDNNKGAKASYCSVLYSMRHSWRTTWLNCERPQPYVERSREIQQVSCVHSHRVIMQHTGREGGKAVVEGTAYVHTYVVYLRTVHMLHYVERESPQKARGDNGHISTACTCAYILLKKGSWYQQQRHSTVRPGELQYSCHGAKPYFSGKLQWHMTKSMCCEKECLL